MNGETGKRVSDNGGCVRVSDFARPGISDGDAIDLAFGYAKRKNIPTVLFDGRDWIVDRAVEYFSGLTIIVDGVTIKQADGTFDNIFRPEGIIVDPDDPYGFPAEIYETENVKITGKNGARLEGPNVQAKLLNFKKGEVEETFGDIWGWRGFSVYFTRCKNFEFSGFSLTKTRSWAISVDRSSNGYFHDIGFYTTCVNGDGLDIRVGCKDIRIENIRGKTSDDFIALNNGIFPSGKDTEEQYLYPLVASDRLFSSETGKDGDICGILIENVYSATDRYSQAVAFLARSGNSIRDVRIRGVYDDNPIGESARLCMVGAYYHEGYGEMNDRTMIKDVSIDTVVSNSTCYAVLFRENVSGLKIKNVRQNLASGVVVMAPDEDVIEIADCSSASGKIRDSVKNWLPPWEH